LAKELSGELRIVSANDFDPGLGSAPRLRVKSTKLTF